MAFRGRGRGGRFGGSGGPCHAERIKFEHFPVIENLPDVKNVKEEPFFGNWSHRLQMWWKLSPYYYKGVGNDAGGCESIDIERYSAKDSAKTRRQPTLSDCIKRTDEYVPAELAVKHQRSRKRVRWNQESDMTDMEKLDIFEKLEKKAKTEDEKKEGDAAEEEEEIIEESDEEFSDGDYNQGEDFEDDEDDYNMRDDHDDEPFY